MNKDRNMNYMGGGMPNNNFPGGMNMGMPHQNFPNQMMMPNHLEERLNQMERSIRKLEARINRLENPYQEAVPFHQDNNNMYMI